MPPQLSIFLRYWCTFLKTKFIFFKKCTVHIFKRFQTAFNINQRLTCHGKNDVKKYVKIYSMKQLLALKNSVALVLVLQVRHIIHPTLMTHLHSTIWDRKYCHAPLRMKVSTFPVKLAMKLAQITSMFHEDCKPLA